MEYLLVSGARPNFMKIAPLVWELQRREIRDFRLVHTGQHYDYIMSKVFFEQLSIPEPDYFLEVGSATHAVQTAKIMTAFEKVCEETKPRSVIVVGDVNSTMACAIVAKKLGIKVAHIESGLRSFDEAMPEEINRLLTDAISDYLFISEPSGLENLRREGKPEERLFLTGNIMIDTLLFQKAKLPTGRSPYAPEGDYAVVTMHRPSNVDEPQKLREVLEAFGYIANHLPIVFPMHPRTRKRVEAFGLEDLTRNLHVGGPLSYSDFLGLWHQARLVITDSGGIQEETTALGVPCFTIRENTERPITIDQGTNTLVGTTKEKIIHAYERFRSGDSKAGRVPDLWDGQTAARIIDVLQGKAS